MGNQWPRPAICGTFIGLVTAVTACSPAGVLSASPSPGAIDPGAVAAYQRANQALLERARQGVRATVVLQHADGSAGQGYDEYINGTPLRLREIRPDYEAIGVGDTVCRREPDAGLTCEQAEFYLGLREVEESGVRRAQSSFADCGMSRCRRIDIEQTAGDAAELTEFLGGNQPVTVDGERYVMTLLVREDGLPFALTESTWSGTGTTEGLATYTFDYDTPVNPIELPAE